MTSSTSAKLVIVGEYNDAFLPHRATDAALKHAAASTNVELDPIWVSTSAFESPTAFDSTGAASLLQSADAFWIAPGSPYRSLAGALRAIRFARESHVPLLGTCGGFQHLVLEYARNVLDFQDAAHAEYDPDASQLIIARLACSLVDRVLPIAIAPDSLAARLYGAARVEERYYCNFAIHPEYAPIFADSALRVVGRDREGEIRMMELSGHPFFLGTLFVPQLRSTAAEPHPLVVGFVKQAALTAERRRKDS